MDKKIIVKSKKSIKCSICTVPNKIKQIPCNMKNLDRISGCIVIKILWARLRYWHRVFGFLPMRLIGFIPTKLKKEREDFFAKNDTRDLYNIPIFIISYNRLYYLKRLVERLEKMGYKNVKIIDNHSSYPPLLQYYGTIQNDVFYMKKNYGHMVFWKCKVFKKYRDDLYVVTDPDVLPVNGCPNNFVEHFYELLKRYPRLKKVGFSLKINDIPKDSPLYKEIVSWESAFYIFRVPGCKAHIADIDTTFALYIPDKLDISKNFFIAVRTDYPYQLKHLPWYKKKNDISEEDIYYNNHRINGWWDEIGGKMTEEGQNNR